MGTIELGTLQVLLALKDNLSGPLMMLQRRIMSTAYNMRQAGLAISSAVTLPLVGMFAAISVAAISFERSFTGVLKTVSAATDELGGLSKAGAVLRQTLLEMSSGLPLSVNELTNIASVVGQLGVTITDIPDYVDAVARMGIAFQGLNTENIALSTAQFLQVMGEEGPDAPHRFASAVTELGNTLATQEKPIIEYAKRMTGISKVTGVAAADIIAVGAAMAASGVRAESGATSMQRVMVALERAVQTGKLLKEFSGVAGLDPDQLRQMWSSGAGGDVILELTRGIAKASGGTSSKFEEIAAGAENVRGSLSKLGEGGRTTIKVLDSLDLGNQRTVRSILALSGSVDILEQAMGASRASWRDMNSHVRESEIFIAAIHSQFLLLWNDFKRLSIELGTVLLPMFQAFISFMRTRAVPVLGDLVEAFVALPQSAQLTVFALLGMAAALGPLILLASQLAMALSPLILFAGAGGGLGVLAGAKKATTAGGDPWRAAFEAEKAALFAAGNARNAAATQAVESGYKTAAASKATTAAVVATSADQVLAHNKVKAATHLLATADMENNKLSATAIKASHKVKTAAIAREAAGATMLARTMEASAANQARVILSTGKLQDEVANKNVLVQKSIASARSQASKQAAALSTVVSAGLIREKADLNALTADRKLESAIRGQATKVRIHDSAIAVEASTRAAIVSSEATLRTRQATLASAQAGATAVASASQSQKAAAAVTAANAAAARNAVASTATVASATKSATSAALTGISSIATGAVRALAPIALVLAKWAAIAAAIGLAYEVAKKLYSLTLAPDSDSNQLKRMVANAGNIADMSQQRADRAYARGNMEEYERHMDRVNKYTATRLSLNQQLSAFETTVAPETEADRMAALSKKYLDFLEGYDEDKLEAYRRALLGLPSDDDREKYEFLKEIMGSLNDSGIVDNLSRIITETKRLAAAGVEVAEAFARIAKVQVPASFAALIGSAFPSPIVAGTRGNLSALAAQGQFGSSLGVSERSMFPPGYRPPIGPEGPWVGDHNANTMHPPAEHRAHKQFMQSMQDSTDAMAVQEGIVDGVSIGLREFARVVGGARGELLQFAAGLTSGLQSLSSGGGFGGLISGLISGGLNLLSSLFNRPKEPEDTTAADSAAAYRERRAAFFGFDRLTELTEQLGFVLTATVEELELGWRQSAGVLLEARAAGLLSTDRYSGVDAARTQWGRVTTNAGLTLPKNAPTPYVGLPDSWEPPENVPASVPSKEQVPYLEGLVAAYDSFMDKYKSGDLPWDLEDLAHLQEMAEGAGVIYAGMLPPEDQINAIRALLKDIERVSKMADAAGVIYDAAIPSPDQIGRIQAFLNKYHEVTAALETSGPLPSGVFADLRAVAELAGIEYEGLVPSIDQIRRLQELVDNYAPLMGLLDTLQEKMDQMALLEGVLGTIQKLLDEGATPALLVYAEALREAQAAGIELSEYQRLLAVDLHAVDEAAQLFGLTMADADEPFKDAHIAQQLYVWAQQFGILNDAISDTSYLLENMSDDARDALIDLILESVRAGIQIPANLRGFIDVLIESSHLTEEQAELLRGLGDEDFATPIEEQMVALLASIETAIGLLTAAIIALIQSIQEYVNQHPIKVPVEVETPNDDRPLVDGEVGEGEGIFSWMGNTQQWLTDNPLVITSTLPGPPDDPESVWGGALSTLQSMTIESPMPIGFVIDDPSIPWSGILRSMAFMTAITPMRIGFVLDDPSEPWSDLVSFMVSEYETGALQMVGVEQNKTLQLKSFYSSAADHAVAESGRTAVAAEASADRSIAASNAAARAATVSWTDQQATKGVPTTGDPSFDAWGRYLGDDPTEDRRAIGNTIHYESDFERSGWVYRGQNAGGASIWSESEEGGQTRFVGGHLMDIHGNVPEIERTRENWYRLYAKMAARGEKGYDQEFLDGYADKHNIDVERAMEGRRPAIRNAEGERFFTPEARMDGGPVGAGVPYWVGERGPELFTPHQSGAITPNGIAHVLPDLVSGWSIAAKNLQSYMRESALQTAQTVTIPPPAPSRTSGRSGYAPSSGERSSQPGEVAQGDVYLDKEKVGRILTPGMRRSLAEEAELVSQ